MNLKRLTVLVLICVLFLTGCGKEDAEVVDSNCTLRVTTSSWSGWSESYEPKEEDYEYTFSTPCKILVPPDGEFEIEILEMDSNQLVFETQSPMSPYGNRFSLISDLTVFTIYRGQTLSLVTPTFDYGEIYILEYIGAGVE